MKNILLLDDDAEVRKIVCRFLEGSEFTVFAVESIADAKHLIEGENTLDAALVDFWLGNISSVHFLDYLRDRLPDLPIILISGGGRDIDLETTQAVGDVSGVTQFLHKPFRKSELLDLLNDLV